MSTIMIRMEIIEESQKGCAVGKCNMEMEKIEMDRYEGIKERLLKLCEQDAKMKAVVAIGSSTRDQVKADEYSDLDLALVTEDTDSWIYGTMPEKLGDIKISFVEHTIDGGMERRILYDGNLDVDMIALEPMQFLTAIKEGEANMLASRGYAVLYDTIHCTEVLEEYVSAEIVQKDMSEAEFTNLVHNFYFHTVWASKKILRGELWCAKMCMDGYLKNHLLQMMEMYGIYHDHVDVWHDGRFLDRWADEKSKQELKNCFAHYEKEDMVSALFGTFALFKRLAAEVAKVKQMKYPKEAEEYAAGILKGYFQCEADE